MVCMIVAQYPVPVCVVVGLAGGLACGVLAQWWKLQENPKPPETEDSQENAGDDTSDDLLNVPKAFEFVRKGLEGLGPKRRSNQRQRSKHPRFGLFGRTRPPQYSRSRRR